MSVCVAVVFIRVFKPECKWPMKRLGASAYAFWSKDDPRLLGRIIIVEDLTKSVIETLRFTLQIHSLFFTSYLSLNIIL